MEQIMRRIPRFITPLLLAVFLPTALYAGGNRQIATETAEGTDIWQHDFDVSGLKKGTYNILVTAKDAAGNEGISGPFNVIVDPMAGLPEARIVYPEQNNIIRGDVNIVGVASARYGLKQVLVRLDNEENRVLEGSEYWNLHIPAEELNEGRHTIYVKSIDTNDLSGPEYKVDFILDLYDPVFELINHSIGDLISGTVRIRGKVTDYNGLRSLSISTDGENYKNLRHSAGRWGDAAKYYNFSIPTKKYNDGPLVYYLRAVNNNGFAVTRPFLFYVNNNPPEIEILSPAPGETVFGRTQVTGRVHSPVGLDKFYFEWAGEQTDIPIRPGDPFWAVTFPISLANNRAIPFRVTAIDKSGNVTTITQRFQDTRRNRTPTLSIDYPPLPGGLGRMQLEYDQPIYGHILEGFIAQNIVIDGVNEYVWARPSFRIPPEMIPIGTNTIRIWAMDEEDVMGQPGITLRINKKTPPPGYEITRSPITIFSPFELVAYFMDDIYDNDTADPHPWVSDSVTISGCIDDYQPGYRLEYRFRWNDAWKQIETNNSGEFNAEIDLSRFPEGYIPLEMRTVRNGQNDLSLYLPVNKYVTQPVITFLTPNERFGFVQRATTASGIIKYHVPLEEVFYSLDGVYYEPLEFTAKAGIAWFHRLFDFTAMHSEGQVLRIKAVDRAGNEAVASPNMVFDNKDAFPKIIHNAPLTGDLITGDFEVSGLAYVEVGISAVFWRLLTPRNPWESYGTTLSRGGDVEWKRLDTDRNYMIPLTLEDVRDGMNILEIFAQDIYGVRGEVLRHNFRVSTSIPDTVVTEPAMGVWSRKNLLVRGRAFDRNGIEAIEISMDNGVSYQRADFASSQADPSEWNINVNTQAYSDGFYSMLIRTRDRYGQSSFTSALINIDNTMPTIDLGSPGNGERFGESIPVTGQIYDNVNLDRIAIQLVNIDDPREQIAYDLVRNFIIMESIDVSIFSDGDYILRVSAFDKSGNENSVIRNINILKARAASEVTIINPLPGIEHSGPLIISGKITGAVVPDIVTLLLDHRAYTKIDVNRYGIFRYEINDDSIFTEKPVVFSASFTSPSGETIVSYDSLVKLNRHGPALVIDSHMDGDVITGRPWLSGRAYVIYPDMSNLPPNEVKAISVARVELSFDNGRTFKPTEGLDSWKFRLETGEMSNGPLPIIVKASYDNGSFAIRRILLTVDTRAPQVVTIGPNENSSHRDTISVYGSVTDDFDMDSVQVSLRPGDKAGYLVPAFIQGLYFDGMLMGSMIWSAGFGLTFFDDNVKIQIQAAEAPSGRYSGWAFGTKVLANIWTLNLSQWFGPDWGFWQTSITLGAHFSYFLMEEGEIPLWMGRFLGQWEIIKADMGFFFPKWKYFKSFSLYAEPGIWFAPSDVSGNAQAWRVKFSIGFGGRISLF